MKLNFSNIFVVTFVLLFLKSAASSVDVQCKFQNDDFSNIANQYSCMVEINLEIASRDQDINEVRGTHAFAKSISDVTGLSIRDKKIQYIPKNLGEKFNNLIAMRIRQGRLKEITRDDMKQFPKLRYVNFDVNDVKVLENGVFDFNPLLEVIWFEGNQIKSIGSRVFKVLDKLRDLDMNSNICVSSRADNGYTMPGLMNKIKQSCTNIEGELDVATKMVEDLKVKLEKLEQTKDNDIKTLKSEIVELKHELEMLKEKEAENEEKLFEKDAEIADKKVELVKFIERLENSTKEAHKMDETFKEQSQNYKNALIDLSKDFDTKIEIQKSKNERLTFELAECEQNRSNLSIVHVQEIEAKLLEFKNNETKYRENLTSNKADLMDRDVQIVNLTQYAAENSQKISNQLKEISDLNRSIQEYESKLKNSEANKADLEAQVAQITVNNLQTEKKVKELTQKLSKSEENEANLLRNNQELSDELQAKAEMLTKSNDHSHGSTFVIAGAAFIGILTILNIFIALKYYREKKILLRPFERDGCPGGDL